jgi:RNA polymerase sigma-70 factor, ECF subfamily
MLTQDSPRYFGKIHRTDSHRTDSHRTDSHRTDSHRTDSHRTDSHRTTTSNTLVKSQVTKKPELSDVDLISALQAGQTEALALLYDRHARLIYTVALRILGSPEEAEDLTQEIFFKLKQGTTYDYSRGSLTAFLSIVTRSRALDRLRVRNNRLQVLHRWQHTMAVASPQQPTDYATSQERSQVVFYALQQLPANQREVLEIAYYEGLTQSQLAERLHIPLGTAKTRSRKGLIKLRELLGDMVN